MRFAIGTYTDLGGPGITLVSLENDRLTLDGVTSDRGDNPIWLEQDPVRKNVCYAACNTGAEETGWVASYRMDKTGWVRTSLQPTHGRACCHLLVNSEAGLLYAANYLDGSVSVFPITDQGLQAECQHLQQHGTGPDKERQECAHAHQLTRRPGTDELFVCDLGADKIVTYHMEENGLLSVSGEIGCKPGIGPRHLLFDGPDGFWLVGELDGWIARYCLMDKGWNCVQLLQTADRTPGIVNTAAAIRCGGGQVYVSNRGQDTIAVFGVEADGRLNAQDQIPVPGSFPRDFRLVGERLLIACQNEGGLCLTDMDGHLLSRAQIPGAVCILPLTEEH